MAAKAPASTSWREIFADPMFSDIGIPRYELLEVADNAPSVADAVSRLYAALVERRQHPVGGEPDETSLVTPDAWVRDHIQAQRNYFGYLEEAAEMLAGALGEPLLLFETVAAPAQGRLRHRDPDRSAGNARRRPASIMIITASG